MRVPAAAACLLLALIAAACGGSSSGDSRDEAPPPSATAEAGGTIEVALTDGANNARVAINFVRALAVSEGGELHAVWVEGLEDGAIWYGRSPDGGATWEQPFRLAEATLPQEGIAAVAASGDTVYVAWHDFSAPHPRIFMRRSFDAGESWEEERVVVDGPAASFPSIAARGDALQLVFANTPPGERLQEIHATRSEDRGETWGEPERLSTIPYASFVPHAGIGEQGGYAVWVDYQDANEEIYLRRWTAGDGWTPSQRLSDDPADSWAAQMAVEGDIVHVAWFDRRASSIRGEAIEERFNDALELVGVEAAPVPPRSADSYYLPSLNARLEEKRGAIAAAAPDWVAGGGDARRLEGILQDAEALQREWAEAWEIYYRRSLDGGLSFEPEQRISDAAGPSLRPSIAVDGDDVYVAWFDSRWSDAEIYLRSSSDGGASWGEELRVTEARGPSQRPTVALDDEFVHLVWADGRSGNVEVYYGRLPRAE